MGEQQTIGPYRLGRVLGRGGMGVVHAAEGPRGARLALKLIRPALRHSPMLARFQREAAVRIEHRNVVRLHDHGVAADGSPYLVFERLEGEALAERLARDGPLSVAETLTLGAQLCEGLDAAHRAGFVHRDIKPSNLFLCGDGTLKVLDFGIAAWSDDARTRMTQSGQVVGTVAYLSPEQAEGRTTPDPRGDLWAVGVVLYELLTGRTPFDQGAPLPTMVAIMLGEPPPLRSLRPDAPAALEALVHSALRKAPDARPGTAQAMAEALRSMRLGANFAARVSSIRAGERRLCVVVHAEEVEDLETFERVVASEGGVILYAGQRSYLGLFGGQAATGDEARRAIAAALRVRPFVGAVGVAAGHLTSSERGLVGSVLQEAAEAAAASDGGVALGQELARSLPEALRMRFDAPFAILDPVHPDPDMTLDALDERLPLVGRESELAQLRDARDALASDGGASLVWLVGEPGVGTSRLLHAAPPKGVRTLEARVEPHRVRGDLALWRALVVTARDAQEGDLEEMLDAAFSERDPLRADVTHGLHLLTDIAGAETQPATRLHDLRQADDRVRTAIVDWLLALAARAPLVLLLEDLHWADAASLTLLQRLMESAYDAPLLIVATTRPSLFDAHPGLGAGAEVRRVDVRELSRRAATELANVVARRHLGPGEMRRVLEIAGGNPFFVVQLVRALVDEEGTDESLVDLAIPPSVEGVVQSRIDHLTERERLVCQAAAVWAGPFGAEELEALGFPNGSLELAGLRRKGLLAPRGAGRYDFASTLLRSVAYRMLDAGRGRTLHGAAARWLESPRSLPSQVAASHEELARHYEHGGDARRATKLYEQAALAARTRGDAQTVLRASAAAIRLGATQRYRMYLARADALRFLGRRRDQLEELDAALSFAETTTDTAHALSEKAISQLRLGQKGARSTAEHAIDAARSARHADTLLLAQGRLGLVLLAEGALDEAEAVVEAASRWVPSESHLRALVAEWRGQVASARGALDARRGFFEEAAELHRQAGDLRRAAGAESNAADVDNRLGQFERAKERLERAVELCRRVHHRAMEGYAHLNLAYSLIALGDVSSSLGALDRAAKIATRIEERRLALLVDIYRSRALRRSGAPAEARRIAEEAARGATGVPSLEVLAFTAAAASCLQLGDEGAAEAHSSRAWEGLRRLGGLEEDEIEVFAIRAAALDAVGRERDASDVRKAARARLQELSLQLADATLRESFLTRVPAHRDILRGEPAA